MQLTRFTDYSLRVLVYLARHPDEWVNIRQISEDHGISRNHLMKVACFLRNQGYLNSRRGPGGGIRLKQPPASIRLADVIEDAESDLVLLECMGEGGLDPSSPNARLRGILTNALQAFLDALNGHTVEDLLNEKQGAPDGAPENQINRFSSIETALL